jgi:hypothetical protein
MLWNDQWHEASAACSAKYLKPKQGSATISINIADGLFYFDMATLPI